MHEKYSRKLIENKHLMAIDYGQKFTGIATYKVGNDPFILAHGRIKYSSDNQLLIEIKKIIDDEFIDMVVLGIPLFTDGKESTMTKTVKNFGIILSQNLSLPIYYQDETLSSFEAEERMKNDPRYNFKVDYNQIDALAATIILESFLGRASN